MSRPLHGVATALRVLRAEGLAAARDRVLDRLADARRARGFRPLAEAEVARFAAPVLNVLATPPSPRFGGVPTQLLARLRCEEKERPVALLHPTGKGYRLELTREGRRGRLDLAAPPVDPLALLDAGFEAATLTAAERTGARGLHPEGVAGLPLESLLRLRERGLRLVLSVHDFGLFCIRPHLVERPAERFCGYCTDLERCARCLASDWRLPAGHQARRRGIARELLAAADAVVYPSSFLRDRHADLFGPLDSSRQHVIEPALDLAEPAGTPAPLSSPRAPGGAPRHIAYVGAVHVHKGALVFEEVVNHLRDTPGLRFTVFGGGDPALLMRLSRLPRVHVRGYYRAGSLPRLLREAAIDLALLLSIWPESYGLTLDECRAAGVPVVAFDHGAMGERVKCAGAGEVAAIEEGVPGLVNLIERSRRSAREGARPFGFPEPGTAAALFRGLYEPGEPGIPRASRRGED